MIQYLFGGSVGGEVGAITVEASCSVAKNQVEHTQGFDDAAEIGRVSAVLAEAY